jgi:hypothetical protein
MRRTILHLQRLRITRRFVSRLSTADSPYLIPINFLYVKRYHSLIDAIFSCAQFASPFLRSYYMVLYSAGGYGKVTITS